MESKSDQPPLVVIVGETASGKSALAVNLAQRFNGEIIAADSRTLYKDMDIGTAKPTDAQRALVPHHLIDISTPDKPLTAADFKRLADETIQNISARGKLPFLVGGTGLYIDAVVYDFSFGEKGGGAERHKWQRLSVRELQDELQRQDIPLPNNAKNSRHLVRQLETKGMPRQPKLLRPNTLIIGLMVEREELALRIAARIDDMFAKGLPQEVKKLSQKYGWVLPPMQTIGYQEFENYDPASQTPEELKKRIIKNTLQYAKRQRTWFRRNKSIHWCKTGEESVDLITTFLNK